PEGYLRHLYHELKDTPFKSIKLDLEEVFYSILLLKPKMYYGVSMDAKVKVRGIATARKDRPVIVKQAVELLYKVLCFEKEEIGSESSYSVQFSDAGLEAQEATYPTGLKRILPVRRAVEIYSEEENIVHNDNGEPEEWFREVPSSIPIPQRFDPCMEIPFMTSSRLPDRERSKAEDVEDSIPERPILMIISENVSREGTILSALEAARGNVASWTFSSPTIKSLTLGRELSLVTTAYDRRIVPLYFFEGSALYEQRFNSGQSKMIWGDIFTSCLTGVRKRNLLGTISDNSVVDVRPFDRDADFAVTHDVSVRTFKREWRGFIDSSFTTANTEAGVLHSIVSSVQMRIRRSRTIMNLETMISVVDLFPLTFQEFKRHRSMWLLHFGGGTGYIRGESIPKLVRAWRSDIHIDMPSLHIFREERVVSITAGNGCLVRQNEVTNLCFDEGADVWMDSLVFNSPEMRRELGIESEYPTTPLEFMRYHASLIPYVLYNGLPRPTLALFMGPQAIAFPNTTINMLFANDRRCYENSVVLSQEVNDLHLADYVGSIRHSLPERERIPKIGDCIPPETEWYRIASTGTVTGIDVTPDRGVILTLSLQREGLRVGDKLATPHGQKQTIAAILPKSEMPLCRDPLSGKTFRPHVIMAAISMHNRETIGQLFESRASLKVVDIDKFSPLQEYEPYVTAPLGEDFEDLEPRECSFTYPGSVNNVLSTIKESKEPCEADYRICRFWSLSHLLRDKQHYASFVPKGIQTPQGKLKGGSVRIGDLDLLTIGAKGLIHSAEELLNSSDTCIVTVCKRCERLSLLCDCV
ncbi:hypothetical protein KEM54_002121, partial [Ascosphaera aggregata]